MVPSEFTVRVHDEGEGTLWAEVVELPGCFATGDTRDELLEGLRDAIALHMGQPSLSATWAPQPDRVEERRILVAR